MQNEIAAKLGTRIKSVRTAQKLTQEKLAEQIGKSIGLIGQIERGEAMPSVDTLVDIIRVLRVNPNSILGDFAPEDHSVSNEVLKALSSMEEVQQRFVLDFVRHFSAFLGQAK